MRNSIRERAIDFALRIIILCQVLDKKDGAARTISKQLVRAGTSIGANIAESDGAQSEADFLTKNSIAVKEARETQYWLELLSRSEIVPSQKLTELQKECGEIIAILTSICKKLKAKKRTPAQDSKP